MRVLLGGVGAGIVLYLIPGLHSGPACLIAGMLTALLMVQLGPRSIVEKVGAGMTVALIAWISGPRPAPAGHGLLRHLAGWLIASAALAACLHPRTE